MRRRLTLLLSFSLAACAGGNLDDLKQYVENSGQGLRGKAEALPEVRPYEPFVYSAFDLPDPFRPRKMESAKSSGGGLQPDTLRRKEALEAYPLENLRMVGFLQKENLNYALVSTPSRELFQVKIGNYLGQNYGMVTDVIIRDVADAEIKLTELVQDDAGNWTERKTGMTLVGDEAEAKPSPPSPPAQK
jgi:type IV pilus assembly protein PilP